MAEKLWLLLPISLIPCSFLFLRNDCIYFLLWWLVIMAGGLAMWPLFTSLLPSVSCSYLVAKAAGMLIPAFFLWQMAHLKILPLSRWSAALCFLICLLPVWLWPAGRRQTGRLIKVRNSWRTIALCEFMFAAILLFWTFARGLKPELDSLEKFMNIGFMNSIWRSDFLPAADMWFAGGRINYYYFGQYLYTYLARLADIRPEIAYNLGMATTMALTFTLAYAIVSQLLQAAAGKDRRLTAPASVCGGLVGAGLTTFAGNSHAFFFAENSPGFILLNLLRRRGVVSADSTRPFWFADPTRFIGYNPDTADKTIHEFPYYSFLVADLHAHVINLAMVLLLLACLVGLLKQVKLLRIARSGIATPSMQDEDDFAWHRRVFKQARKRLFLTICNGPLFLISLLLAVFMMGNYWDFAIYLVVCGITLLLVNSKAQGKIADLAALPLFLIQIFLIIIPYLFIGNPLWDLAAFFLVCMVNNYLTVINSSALNLTAAQVSWIFALSHLLALPFNLGFEPISKQISLVAGRTPLWQFCILWGAHILAGCIFILIWILWGRKIRWSRNIFPPPAEARLEAQISGNWQSRLFRRQTPADIFVFTLFIWAIGLLILPELVYVVDIYSGEFKRANTMFKFTYQAYVLLSLVWAFGLARLVFTAGKKKQASAAKSATLVRAPLLLAGIFLSALLIIPAWYTPVATRQWLGSFSRERYRGLDGLDPLARKDSAQISEAYNQNLSADVAAIRWLNENVEGQPVILEANGESYTDFCRISAFTGLPTIIGWETHQWLWRTGKSQPDAYGSVVRPRQEVVRTIYTTDNQTERRDLLEQYNVSLIIVGNLERERFSRTEENGTHTGLVEEEKLKSLGTIIFSQDDLYIISLAGHSVSSGKIEN